MAPVILLVTLMGLIVGSFANVPIHRWPRGGTVLEPTRSACPACDAPIRWYDNIPVVSWFVLRARCRDCGHQIPGRYAAVEAAMAMLFAATALVHGLTWELPTLLAFVWVLVVAAVIDLEHRIIPNRLTYRAAPALLVLLVLAAAMTGEWGDLRRALIAGLAIPAIMLAMSELFRLIRGAAGIGMGDIKLAPSIGLVVGYLGGWELVVWFYATAISAVVVAFTLIAAGRAKLATRIPYGPYLALGALTAVLAGEPLGDLVSRWLGFS
jgi:leader peptidase (prepilin peptidase)/N-methyltransferase